MPEESAPSAPGRPLARLRFSLPLRELLVAMVGRVHTAAAEATDEPPPSGPNPAHSPDPDLDAAWAEGLREREEYDNHALLALVMNPKFGLADLPLTPAAAEAIARASVRVRLHLRETLLRDLNAVEVDGDVDVFRLPAVEQQGYACFRLLAHLEEDLIHQLDPGIAKS
jgi:hypothetical protein